MKLTLSKIVYLLFAFAIFISALFSLVSQARALDLWYFWPGEDKPGPQCWFELVGLSTYVEPGDPDWGYNPGQHFHCRVSLSKIEEGGDWASVHCGIALCGQWITGCNWSHWDGNDAVFDCRLNYPDGTPLREDFYLLIGYEFESYCDSRSLAGYLQVGSENPGPPPPRNLTSSCDGSSATVSWDPPIPAEGYSQPKYYSLFVDDLTDGWDGSCSSPAGDFCVDGHDATSYTFSATPGHTYYWWVHALYECYSGVKNDDELSERVYGDPFTCAAVNNPPYAPAPVAPPHNTWINYNPNFQARVSDPDGGNVRAYFSWPANRWGSWVSSGGTSRTGSIGVSDTSGSWWRAYAQDPNGATSGWSGWWFLKKDTVVPSRNIDQENGTSTNTSIWVNLSESDNRSGVATGDVDVRINGGSWRNYSSTTSNFTYTGSDGNTYEFRYRVQDNAGNWSSFDYDGSVTIRLNQAPTVDSVTISSDPITADGSTQYTITIRSSDGNGVTNLNDMRTLINYQGSNAGSYRGYFRWDDSSLGGSWTQKGSCSGGGYYGKYASGYGYQYVDLISCSTSTSGNQRTVNFVFHANTNWGTDGPLTSNDISGWTMDDRGLTDGWDNFDLNFGVTSPLGTISGYVWEDDGPVCPVGGDKYEDKTNAVSATSGSGSFSANTDGNGYYVFSSVPHDTWQVTVNKPVDWTCACAGGTSGSCTKTVVVDLGTPNSTVDFSIFNNPSGWMQTRNGDVYASSISISIPNDPHSSYERWFIDAVPDSSGGGVALSSGSIDCNGWASQRGWEVDNYSSISWPGTLDSIDQDAGVIDYETDFSINSDAEAAAFAGKILVAENNITISGDVTQLNAVLVAKNQVVINGSGNNNVLTITGAMFAKNGFSLPKTLNSNKKPAIVVEYDPSYLLQTIPGLTEARVSWKEVKSP